MADPFTLAAIGMVGSAAGAGVKAFGQMQEGQATANMYAYKAAVAQQNAAYQRAVGEVTAQRKGMEERFKIGETVAAQGASGLDVAGESATRVRESMHDVARQEQNIIRSDAARRAYGEEEEAKLDIMAGEQAKKASKIAAFGSILGGVSSVSDKWMYGRQTGIYS